MSKYIVDIHGDIEGDYEIIKKYEEQQPCDDAVSRQAAIEAIMGQPPEPHYPSWYAAQIEKLPAVQPERKKPVFKTGESVYHVSYADGTGGFEKNKWADWTCPDCGWFVGEQYIPRRHSQQKCNYCAKCGCAIDWSDKAESED